MVFDKGSQPKALCTLSCKYSKDEQEKKGTDSSFFFSKLVGSLLYMTSNSSSSFEQEKVRFVFSWDWEDKSILDQDRQFFF